MALNFEWDENKARSNIQKHGISFAEATTVFDDPYYLTFDDPLHSVEELRFLSIGYSIKQRLLVVVYTERNYNIRIISARLATKNERSLYE
jgi:uncharacterized DUF497 family protein